jgi:hypothetical protein
MIETVFLPDGNIRYINSCSNKLYTSYADAKVNEEEMKQIDTRLRRESSAKIYF